MLAQKIFPVPAGKRRKIRKQKSWRHASKMQRRYLDYVE